MSVDNCTQKPAVGVGKDLKENTMSGQSLEKRRDVCQEGQGEPRNASKKLQEAPNDRNVVCRVESGGRGVRDGPEPGVGRSQWIESLR